jgi:glucan biosynthesis protein C
LFGYLRIAPVDLPRDLSLFIIGTLAYRNDWVMRFSSRSGYAWLYAGILLAGMWFLYDLWLADVLLINNVVWGLIHPAWEALLCVSMCIGVTVLFRDRINFSGTLAREMALSTYAAYMLHVFIAVFFQLLVRGLEVGPLIKFALVSLVTVPASFFLGSLIRRPLRL